MDLTVTCVIPAWNEAARLPGVLSAILGHPWVDEVLVVDDGSADETAQVARGLGARVLTLVPNGGKSAAVAAGLREARGAIILLLDADLQGLTARHVTALLRPLRTGVADASVSLRSNAPWLWRVIGIDYISGERAMFASTLKPQLGMMAGLRGFGLEVFLNRLWLRERHQIAIVPLVGVASPSKMAKRGWARGVADDLRMLRDIFYTVGIGTVLYQIAGLRAARIR
jgi:glycosyltransferase involved in cell wall biosynthesis